MSVRPISDVDTTLWKKNAGASVAAVLADGDSATYATSHKPVRDPQRIIFVLADDQRFDDFYATMTSGPRAGERCMETVCSRIRDMGAVFTNMRIDYGLCGPFRTSFLTGLMHENHNVGNTAGDYYAYFRGGTPFTFGQAGKGQHDPRQSSGANQWPGPWEFDVAAMYAAAVPEAYDQTSLPQSHWPNVGFTAGARKTTPTIGIGDTTDDLQAFTGSLFNWLAQAGVTVMHVGKYINGYGVAHAGVGMNDPLTDQWVPPGVAEWFGHVGDINTDGDIQDKYHLGACEFTASAGHLNPGDGTGESGIRVTFDYDWEISSITHNGLSGAAGRATVTTVNPIGSAAGGPLVIGDEIAIDGVTGVTAYNTPYAAVTAVNSTSQFEYAVAGPLAAGTVSAALAYPRKLFPEVVCRNKALAMLDRRGDDEDFLLYYATQMPHAEVNTADPAPGPANQAWSIERRYEGTVPQSQAYAWGGTPGAISPAHDASQAATSDHTIQWTYRAEMLASFNDTNKALIDYCDARWGPSGYTIVYMSDNGLQQGEHATDDDPTVAWSPVGGKGMVYEGSIRLPCFVRSPYFTPGTNSLMVAGYDWPMTLLDLFAYSKPALANHHAHTKRDGYSILRLIRDVADAAHGRAFLVFGEFKSQNNSYGILDQSLLKLVRTANLSALRLWDLTGTDWETVDIAGSHAATVTAMEARLALLKEGRWDPVSGVNTTRTV